MSVEASLILCRFLRDASALGLWGAMAYLAILVPPDLADTIDERLSLFRIGSGLLALTMTAAFLPLQAGVIGEGWSDVVNFQTIHDVVFETTIGHAWLVQAVAAAGLLLALLVRRPRHRRRAIAAACGLFLVTLALGGHAAMRSGLLGAFQRLNDAVHLLSAGAWLGALLPLVAILAQSRSVGRNRAMRMIALWRFSRAGRIAVVAVILTGVGNTVLVVGEWPVNWNSTYQLLLTLKIALAMAITALAVVNRYVIVPRLSIHSERAVSAIRMNSMLEIGIGLVIVGLVATFGTLDPR